MADKRISQLVEATTMTSTDIFVVEQDSQTKKVTEQTFVNALATALSGKGGISSITKTSTSGLVDTYTITYANQSTSTFTVTNGSTGSAGLNGYVHIKYSTNEPTQDSDMHSWADRWLGTATSNSATAPTTYTSYAWYDTKGAKGDTGENGTSPTLESSSILYCDSDDGSTVPTTGWQSTVPTVAEGHFLWTKITIEFSTGDPIVAYSVGKIGTSGSGSGTVSSVGVACSDSSLTVTGSPITSTGTVNISHANTTLTPQTTAGVYPIKIDAKGHITNYGTAATAASLGGIANPTTKSQGQVLTYDGSTWVAQNASGAVASVNGYTGTVVLDADDVSAVTNPATKTLGNGLLYNGSSWVATPVCGANLLDNWWFEAPVNQRGVSSLSGGGYGIDRWKASSTASYTYDSSTGTFTFANTGTSDAAVVIYQSIKNGQYLAGKKVSISAIIDGALLTATGTIPALTSTASDVLESSATGSVYLSLRWTGSLMNFRIMSSEDVSGKVLTAVKLEVGAAQTIAYSDGTAYQLTEIPNYGEQLRRCQRYFWRMSLSAWRPISTGYSNAADSSNPIYVRFPVPLPAEMASTISLGSGTSAASCFRTYGGAAITQSSTKVITDIRGTSINCGTIAVENSGTNTVVNLKVTAADGSSAELLPYMSYTLICNTAAVIEFTCEP